MHNLNSINWRRAILTVGIPLALMIAKDLETATPLRSLLSGALLVIATGVGNYLSDPRK